MLETPSIRRYSFVSVALRRVTGMSSDNPTGADNQQETAQPRLELDPQWVVGFVDGEGCFSVSIHTHPGVGPRGWQLNPVFHVYQHRDALTVLESLAMFFGCGRIRSKGPGSSVLTYAVSRRCDLLERIIPFFQTHPLVVKRKDFGLFVTISQSLDRKVHSTAAGFEHLVRLAYAMNANGKQRARSLEVILAGSSETVRQARSPRAVKIQSDLYGDIQSEAEMTSPSIPE